jgi:hypothetical protein
MAANPATPATVKVTVRPLDPAGPPTANPPLTNQASVSSNQPDPNPGNNNASSSVNALTQSGVTYLDDTNSGFSSGTATAGLNGYVQYTFLGTMTHHVTDTSGLINSGAAGGPRTFYRFKFQAAGSYTVGDSAVPGTETVAVNAKVAKESSTGTYLITWATYSAPPPGYGYDVTLTGPLGTVTTLTPTRAEKTATFSPTDGAGNYTIKARIFNNSTSKGSGYQTSTLTVTRAILLAPKSGTTGSSFTVSGKGFPKSTTVSITFNGTALAPTTTTSSGTFSQAETVPNLPAGSYTVTVTAGSLSNSADFTIT